MHAFHAITMLDEIVLLSLLVKQLNVINPLKPVVCFVDLCHGHGFVMFDG